MAAAIFGASVGCGTLHYAPREPLRDQYPTAPIEVVGIQAPGGRVVYQTELEAPADAKLGTARLSLRPNPGCHVAPKLEWLQVDGTRTPFDRPVPIGGKHQIDLAFTLLPWECAPGSLDVELRRGDKTELHRVPLDIPDKWQIQNDVGMNAGLETVFASSNVTGVLATASLLLGVSVWHGPVRYTLYPGLAGLAICDESVCPMDRGRATGLTIPLGASATWFPWVDDAEAFFNPRGPWAVGLELRVREYLTWLPESGGTDFRLLHTPQAVFHFATSSGNAPHHLPAGPHISSYDAELAIGSMLATDDGKTDAAFVIGGGFGLSWWL